VLICPSTIITSRRRPFHHLLILECSTPFPFPLHPLYFPEPTSISDLHVFALNFTHIKHPFPSTWELLSDCQAKIDP
jgi:hypothetical protein